MATTRFFNAIERAIPNEKLRVFVTTLGVTVVGVITGQATFSGKPDLKTLVYFVTERVTCTAMRSKDRTPKTISKEWEASAEEYRKAQNQDPISNNGK